MADPKMHAGFRINDPVAKYLKFDMDITTMKLTVYVTGGIEGREMTFKGTITNSGWSPVQED